MHVMLDLETMSTKPDAAIVAIGAVAFDPYSCTLGDEFYMPVCLDSATESGGHLDPDTIRWWINQGDDAKKLFEDTSKMAELRLALMCFKYFLSGLPTATANPDRDNEPQYIWGNGSCFDNVILKSAYDRLKLPEPWGRKSDMCYRTIRTLTKNMGFDGEMVREGIHHNALDDAKYQAKCLQNMFQFLKKDK